MLIVSVHIQSAILALSLKITVLLLYETPLFSESSPFQVLQVMLVQLALTVLEVNTALLDIKETQEHPVRLVLQARTARMV